MSKNINYIILCNLYNYKYLKYYFYKLLKKMLVSLMTVDNAF